MEQLEFHRALVEIWEVINRVNRYIDQSAPWTLAGDPQKQLRLHTVLYYALETLKIVTVLLAPIMPDAVRDLMDRLGTTIEPLDLRLEQHAVWGGLQPNTNTRRGKALFPRIEESVAEPETLAPEKKSLLKLDEFARLDLRVGEIIQAESVAGSKNLLKLEIDLGERRTAVAGIADHYRPEDLVGKQVVVVANLKPATLMGVRSAAMVLVSSSNGELTLISPEKKVAPGSPVG
jgi:methionyl-tRNA synthetase